MHMRPAQALTSAVSSGTWSQRNAPYSSDGDKRELLSASNATKASHGVSSRRFSASRTNAACAFCLRFTHSFAMEKSVASGVSWQALQRQYLSICTSSSSVSI